jgi:hypothetical protein
MSHRCPNSLKSEDVPNILSLFRDAEHRVRQKILDLERVYPSVVKNDTESVDEQTGIEIVFNGRNKQNRRTIQIAFVRIDGVLIKRVPENGSFFG